MGPVGDFLDWDLRIQHRKVSCEFRQVRVDDEEEEGDINYIIAFTKDKTPIPKVF